MSTISVKDSSGTVQVVPTLPTNDGTTLPVSGTLAVTGSFYQATQPVSLATLPLPPGAATDASLATIRTALAGTLKADTVVQAVSANRGAVVGTTAVALIPANTSRRGFSIQNQHTSANLYLSGVATATADYNSFMIPPGGYYESPAHHAGTGAISVVSSAASTPVYAREW